MKRRSTCRRCASPIEWALLSQAQSAELPWLAMRPGAVADGPLILVGQAQREDRIHPVVQFSKTEDTQFVRRAAHICARKK